MKAIALYILAAILVVAAVIFLVNYSIPDVYRGTDLNFSLHDYNTLVIESVAQVNFEAASSNFYAMHLGEYAVIGIITKNPLGWEHSNYFATSPTNIKAGIWTIDYGDYTVHMYGDKEIKITVGKTTGDIIAVTFITLLVGVCVWLLVYALAI